MNVCACHGVYHAYIACVRRLSFPRLIHSDDVGELPCSPWNIIEFLRRRQAPQNASVNFLLQQIVGLDWVKVNLADLHYSQRHRHNLTTIAITCTYGYGASFVITSER